MFEKLKELRKMQEREENGFTLIELLVVILIIGILAAIAIPVFLNQRQVANDAAVQSDVKNIATAVETAAIKEKGDYSKITKASLLSDVKTSDGVYWDVSTQADGFCITAYHDNGKSYNSPTTPATYDNKAGGLNKDGGACAAGVDNTDNNGTPANTTSGQIKNNGTTANISASAAWGDNGSIVVTITSPDDVVNNGVSFDGSISNAKCADGSPAATSGGIYGSFVGGSLTSKLDGGSVYGYMGDGCLPTKFDIAPSPYDSNGDWSWVADGNLAIGSISGEPTQYVSNYDPNGGGDPSDGSGEITEISEVQNDFNMTGGDNRYGTLDISIVRGTDNQVTITGHVDTGYTWDTDHVEGIDPSGIMFIDTNQFTADIPVDSNGNFSYTGDGSNIYGFYPGSVNILFNLDDGTQVTANF